jgi:hypothetical protein
MVVAEGMGDEHCQASGAEKSHRRTGIETIEETTNTQRFEADSLADETVNGEPVCGTNSLLTGKRTGNFGLMAQPPQEFLAGHPQLSGHDRASRCIIPSPQAR